MTEATGGLQIHDQFFESPEVKKLGKRGEHAVTAFLMCGTLTTPTDGVVTPGIIEKIREKALITDKDIKRLQKVGLWTAVEGGYRMEGHGRLWLKWDEDPVEPGTNQQAEE
jgi:hypothetical protein